MASRQETGTCVAVHLCLLNLRLETWSALKIKKHHQHREKGGVSLTVCVCIGSKKCSQPPFTQHIHTHTGFIISQHFLEVSPVMCELSQGLSLTLSQSHVCRCHDCSRGFLVVVITPRRPQGWDKDPPSSRPRCFTVSHGHVTWQHPWPPVLPKYRNTCKHTHGLCQTVCVC